PVPGDGGYEWAGYLKGADLPQVFNPKSGSIATANHKILPEGYTQQIGYEFSPPYRYQRIRGSLYAKEKWDLHGFREVQHDDKSLPGLALVRLLKDLKFGDPALEPYQKRFIDWDGRLTVDTAAGPLYAQWLKTLQEAFFAPNVPKEQKTALTSLS